MKRDEMTEQRHKPRHSWKQQCQLEEWIALLQAWNDSNKEWRAHTMRRKCVQSQQLYKAALSFSMTMIKRKKGQFLHKKKVN